MEYHFGRRGSDVRARHHRRHERHHDVANADDHRVCGGRSFGQRQRRDAARQRARHDWCRNLPAVLRRPARNVRGAGVRMDAQRARRPVAHARIRHRRRSTLAARGPADLSRALPMRVSSSRSIAAASSPRIRASRRINRARRSTASRSVLSPMSRMPASRAAVAAMPASTAVAAAAGCARTAVLAPARRTAVVARRLATGPGLPSLYSSRWARCSRGAGGAESRSLQSKRLRAHTRGAMLERGCSCEEVVSASAIASSRCRTSLSELTASRRWSTCPPC